MYCARLSNTLNPNSAEDKVISLIHNVSNAIELANLLSDIVLIVNNFRQFLYKCILSEYHTRFSIGQTNARIRSQPHVHTHKHVHI